MLSGIAHELNNPLSVLAGQAVLLEETATDAATRRRALHIAEQAERCARTVRSFLDLARERPGRSDPVPLTHAVAEAIEMTEPDWQAAGVAVDWAPPPVSPLVLGDADRLRQLVVNLIVNAVQAMEGQADLRTVRLRLAVEPGDGSVVLTVADSGPGVPEPLRDRIFRPFFSTKGAGGSGIGLALCRRIADTHGGRIALVPPGPDDPLRGAHFQVELPPAPRETDQ
nr:HAMP domain-containing sensor histidine kinase [Rhodobacter calidifons]